MKNKDRQLSLCGYNVSDEDKIHTILNGLDKDYDIVHVSVSGRIEPSFVNEVTSMLLNHDKNIGKAWQCVYFKRLLLPYANVAQS